MACTRYRHPDFYKLYLSASELCFIMHHRRHMYMNYLLYSIRPIVIQTEAERRRRDAGVQQAMENGLRSCLLVYVCMFFKNISRSRALSEFKVVSCCSPVNSTFHRHDIIRVRFLSSAPHVKIEKKRLFP